MMITKPIIKNDVCKLYCILFSSALKLLLRAVKLSLLLFCFSASINIQNNSKRWIEPFSEAFSEKHLLTKEKVAKAVWKIEILRGNGTGFFISENEIVTNAHVVKNIKDIEEVTIVQEGNPRQLKANKIVRLSIEHDLVVLEVDGVVSDFLSLPEDPLNSSNVYALGYPQGQFQEIRQTGALSGNYFFSDTSDQIGASGSPVLNEAHQLAGVLYLGEGNYVEFIGLETLKSFINDKNFLCEGSIQKCFKSSIKRIKKNTQEVKSGQDFSNIFMYLKKEYETQTTSWFKKTIQAFINRDIEIIWWLVEAVARGYTPAIYDLGMMERGLHLKIELLTKAAEQGFALAQYELALMYLRGEGVEQNMDKAIELLTKAAEQGFSPAQYKLVLMYLKGEGMEQNMDKAIELLTKAAEQGHAPAQQALDEFLNSNHILHHNVKEMEKAPQKDNCRNIFRN